MFLGRALVFRGRIDEALAIYDAMDAQRHPVPHYRACASLNRVFRNEQRDPLPVVDIGDAFALIGERGRMVECDPPSLAHSATGSAGRTGVVVGILTPMGLLGGRRTCCIDRVTLPRL